MTSPRGGEAEREADPSEEPGQVREADEGVDFSIVFDGAPGAYLLVRPDLKIAAANRAYLKAMRMPWREVVGRDVLEMIGERVGDPGGATVEALQASLRRVLETKVIDEMGVYRCDPPGDVVGEPSDLERDVADAHGTFWRAANFPVLDSAGNVAFLMHRIEDVSEIVRLEQSRREHARLADELFVRGARLQAEGEERFRVVFDQQFQFMALLDIDGRILDVNSLALRAAGVERADVMGRPFWETQWWEGLPEMKAEWPRRLAEAAHRLGPVVTLDQYRSASGEVRFADAATTAVRDADGAVSFFIVQASDCTERKRAEEALLESERRQATLLSNLPGMAYRCKNDRCWTQEFVSAGVMEVTGYTPEDFISKRIEWGQLQYEEDHEWIWRTVQQAIRERRSFELEYRIRHRDGSQRWLWEQGQGIFDGGEDPVALEGLITDITKRKRAEAVAEVLAAAGRELSGSLDYEQTLAAAARAVVPHLADWCAVDIADEVVRGEVRVSGRLRRLATAHVDPEKLAHALTMLAKYPPRADAAGGPLRVLQTGEPELLSEISDDLLRARARSEEHLQALRAAGLRSYICVPLSVHGHTFGAMTFVTAESGRRYDDKDLEVAVEIGRRAAQAIENSRLYRDLFESRRRLHFALKGSAAGVWGLDLLTRQAMWSEELLPLFGFDQFTPRTYERWLQAVHPDDRDRLDSDFWAVVDSDASEFRLEFRIVHPVRGVRWLLSMGRIDRERSGRGVRADGIAIDITERKEHEEQMRVVMAELNHRVKNTLAVIQSIARQTMRRSPDLPSFQRSFEDRLQAIASAHGLLTRTDWRGVSLEDIVKTEVQMRAPSTERCTISGPPIVLRPKAALAMHMIVHELTTNAVKHGGLHTDEGRLEIWWSIHDEAGERSLQLDWRETGPDVSPPAVNGGFGGRLVDQLVEYELQGSVEREFTEAGLYCRIRFPLETAGAARQRESEESRPTDARMRVLVVEDSLPLAMSMREDLEGLGYSVIGPAPTLARGFRLAEHEPPAAAVLDVNLGEEKVYPLARKLRQAGVPILLVTGYEVGDLPKDLRDIPLLNKPVALNRMERFLRESIHNGAGSS